MRFITYLSTLLLAVFLSACGGGGGSSGTPSGTKTQVKTTAPEALTLAVGASQGFSITGGVYPYQVSSSNTQVSNAGVDERNFWIGAVSSGTATITVTDAAAQVTSIKVTVANLGELYTTAPEALVMTPGSSAREFVIGGGQPNYTVFSDNTDIAVVDGSSGSVLKITAKKVGTANIFVSDSATPKKTSVKIAVTVKSLFVLSVSPTTVTTFVAMPTEVYVTGGTPPYRVRGSIPAAINVEPKAGFTGLTDPTTFVVTGTLAGTFDVGFIDSQNVEAKVNLTVQDGTPVIRMSPSALSISELDTQVISLTYYGATPANVFSSDLTLVTVPANPLTTKTFTVKPTGKCVSADQGVTITVVDANKSLSTSVITIKDNGNVAAVPAVPASGSTPGTPAIPGSNCPP